MKRRPASKSSPWYKDGLRFTCQRCGNCCSGSTGNVWVSDEEIAQIAKYLNLREDDFRRRYTINTRQDRTRLAERQNYDCVFYNSGHGCIIYEKRPQQCRTWPFWKTIVREPHLWNEMAKTCPGMNRGRYYGPSEVEAIAQNDGLI